MISLRILVFTGGQDGGHVSLDPVETKVSNLSVDERTPHSGPQSDYFNKPELNHQMYDSVVHIYSHPRSDHAAPLQRGSLNNP